VRGEISLSVWLSTESADGVLIYAIETLEGEGDENKKGGEGGRSKGAGFLLRRTRSLSNCRVGSDWEVNISGSSGDLVG